MDSTNDVSASGQPPSSGQGTDVGLPPAAPEPGTSGSTWGAAPADPAPPDDSSSAMDTEPAGAPDGAAPVDEAGTVAPPEPVDGNAGEPAPAGRIDWSGGATRPAEPPAAAPEPAAATDSPVEDRTETPEPPDAPDTAAPPAPPPPTENPSPAAAPVPLAKREAPVEPAPPPPPGTGWSSATPPTDDRPPAPVPPPAPSPDEEGVSPWVTRIVLGLGILVVIAVLGFVVVVTTNRGGPGPEPARAEAEAFAAAWTAGNVAGMQSLVDGTPPVAADLDAALKPLPVTKTTVTMTGLTGDPKGDQRTANVNVELTAPDLPPIAYTNTVPLRRVDEETWRVVWSRKVIHPAMADAGARFDRILVHAPRGVLEDANGAPLVDVIGEVTISIRPADVVDRPGLEQALQSTLGIDPATVAKAFDAGQVSGQAPIKTVDGAAYEAAKGAIYEIKGLRFSSSGSRQGSLNDPKSESHLGQGLKASQEKALAGLPATEVRIVDGAGQVVQPITKVDGSPARNVRTTIDPRIQQIAEEALRSSPAKDKGGALAVVDRTGAIRALAEPPAGLNWGTLKWPPGSTQKVVTTAALLTKGLTPESPLTCPPTVTAAGQPFKNFEGGSEPSLNFNRAFMISCNTAFIGASMEHLSGAEMMQMARRFGYNVDYDIGIPMAVKGSFPDDGAGAARSSMAIGQGRVEASPVHMASVAATAMTGQWKAPSFLAERPADLPVGEPLDPRVVADLQRMMRANVEGGSGEAAAVPGKVIHGKTGTAEYGTGPVLRTHAWFIGFTGDLAIAVVINDGGVGGRDAAPVANRFFAAL